MFAPKSRGGLGAPEIIKYYFATHIKTIITWFSRMAPNIWVEIEMSITRSVHPCAMIWADLNSFIGQLRSICLGPMLFSLAIWKKCSRQFSLASPCPLLLNVLLNPDIPDSLSYSRMLPWTQAGIFQLWNIVHPLTHTLLPFEELQKKHQIPKQLFYSYLQIRHYFASKSSTLSLDRPTLFELLCAQGPYQTHLITDIYKFLHNATSITDTFHSYMQKWSQLVNRSISLPQ